MKRGYRDDFCLVASGFVAAGHDFGVGGSAEGSCDCSVGKISLRRSELILNNLHREDIRTENLEGKGWRCRGLRDCN